MDIVYILGTGSKCGNLEIKYSLRSLQKHMLDIGRVFIVGEYPEFLEVAEHIPAKDIHKLPEDNAKAKINLACMDERIGENFMLMNDDFFALESFKGEELPNFGTREGVGSVANTISFALHVPYKINKKMWLACPFPTEKPNGFSLRNFYFNLYGAPATPHPDPILRNGPFAKSFEEQIKNWEWFSTTDGIFKDEQFLTWIEAQYPEPSPYERAL